MAKHPHQVGHGRMHLQSQHSKDKMEAQIRETGGCPEAHRAATLVRAGRNNERPTVSQTR